MYNYRGYEEDKMNVFYGWALYCVTLLILIIWHVRAMRATQEEADKIVEDMRKGYEDLKKLEKRIRKSFGFTDEEIRSLASEYIEFHEGREGHAKSFIEFCKSRSQKPFC